MTKAIVRRWGNSLGVVLPKEIIREQMLKADQEIDFLILRQANLTDLYGTLPRKMSGQKFKDMNKKGWD